MVGWVLIYFRALLFAISKSALENLYFAFVSLQLYSAQFTNDTEKGLN